MRKLHRRDWMELPQNRFLRGVYLLIQRFLRHNVGMQGAALAFYLLFMIFPLLIFVSALLGLLHLDVNGILEAAGEFLPRQVVSFIEVYLNYVAANPSMKLLLFGLFFSLYFPMRATNALMRSVRIAYHLGPPRGAFVQFIKTLVYTAVLIAAIALTLTLMTVGDRVLLYAVEHFGLPYFWASLWARLRFPVAGVAGPQLAVRHLCGELRRLLPALRLYRHGHRPADLAVHERRDPHHGGGVQRHADLPAEGPGRGFVNDF